MNTAKYILRGTLLLAVVLLLIYLNGKNDDNIARIAKFKFETFNKIKADSLDTEHKFDLLVNETTKFTEQMIEDSPQMREGVRYLIGVAGLLIAVELGFLIAKRRRPGE
jgi:hypothetical protein